MGRPGTGAYTSEASKRIELSYLLKRGYLKKGSNVSGTLSWTNQHGKPAGDIRVVSHWGNDEIYLLLIYTLTDHHEGIKKDYNCKVRLTSIPSNLGKGDVLYFLCPQTGKRCRTLYNAYHSHIWKSRTAYSHTIFYDAQVCSKLDYANTRYWALDGRIKKIINEKHLTLSYLGEPTKKALRLRRLIAKRDKFDVIRWSCFSLPKSIRGFF